MIITAQPRLRTLLGSQGQAQRLAESSAAIIGIELPDGIGALLARKGNRVGDGVSAVADMLQRLSVEQFKAALEGSAQQDVA